MQNRLPTLLLLILLGTSAQAKDDGKAIYTDLKDVPASYHFQGEYAGDVDDQSYGGHLIALGDNKFRLVGYENGLPNAKNSHKDITLSLEGELKDGSVNFANDELRMACRDGKITVTFIEKDKVIGTLSRVVRKSDTLGAKPPAGAIVLFDGTSADAFDNGALDGKLLKANCSSKEKFGDHTLHLEFRTPYKPTARGQARGNSGVYMQSRYELQVLDSFGLEGKNNECGGIYSISEPKVNMCFPPLQWQTYDIDFTAAKYDDDGKKTSNARATIRHNGVVIHDDLELPHGTPGRHKEGPGADSLYLQGHGNPVVYRNIWVVKK